MAAHKRIVKLKEMIDEAGLEVVEFIGTAGPLIKARCSAGTHETRMFSITLSEGDPRGDKNELARMKRFYREVHPEVSSPMAAALVEAVKHVPHKEEFKFIAKLAPPDEPRTSEDANELEDEEPEDTMAQSLAAEDQPQGEDVPTVASLMARVAQLTAERDALAKQKEEHIAATPRIARGKPLPPADPEAKALPVRLTTRDQMLLAQMLRWFEEQSK